MAEDTPEPVVIHVDTVTLAEAEAFETDTHMTFAEALTLVLSNRVSTQVAKALLRIAKNRPCGDELPNPKHYMELLGLFGPEGRIVIDFGDPKGEAPS